MLSFVFLLEKSVSVHQYIGADPGYRQKTEFLHFYISVFKVWGPGAECNVSLLEPG